ncbi:MULTISPECIES: helix-turn-helix transcriptional regulator [Pseudomonadota]|uniref:S24 family peptidase n=1 Tax=Pseudomonadota TaxID=1224 RepID=UPI001DDE5D67|nr:MULTISPECIES: S24 family peptidase [Pseudomonadota]MPS99512.1 helix-turn-helix transcriptional regulator [Pseudomonas sp.]WON88690.1 helix-turn-helix transcriptional regulator [Delftia sp. UGAL515B_04]
MDKYEQRRKALRALVDRLGRGGISAVAQKIGKESSYVSRMLYPEGKSGMKRIGEDTAEALQKAYPEFLQLLAPVGDQSFAPAPAPNETRASVSSPSEEPSNDGGMPDLVIRQYEDTGGGMSHGFNLEDNPPGHIRSWRVTHDWLRINVPTHTGLKNLCIVTGFGPSMKPMFNPGDPLLVDLGVNSVDHEGAYFFRVGSEGYIKLLQRIPDFNGPGFKLRAISKNSDYEPFDISPTNPYFEVIGKVLTVWRSEQF